MPNPTTEKSAPGSEPRTAESYPTREEVELRAYQIYVERGGAHGQDLKSDQILGRCRSCLLERLAVFHDERQHQL